MPVQSQEHDLSSATLRPVKLSCGMSHNGKRRRPATAPNSTSPSFMLPASLPLRVIPQKVESQTIHDGPLSRVFSRLSNLGMNTKKSREVIPLVPNQDEATVRTSRKLLRRPSQRLSSASITPQTFSSRTATSPTARLVIPRPLLSPTIDSLFSRDISVGDDTENSDEPSVDHRKEVQLQMARLAKLKRHLGEDIPLEMVLSPTLHVDTAEFRDLAGSFSNSKKDQGQRSLDPTASSPALQSSRLRKSRSLRNRKSVFELQPHDDRAIEAVHKKFPYGPQTEIDFQKPRELRGIRATRGSDQVASHSPVSTSHSVQNPPPPPLMSLASTSERLQTRENLVTADLALDNPMNSKDRETALERSTGIECPDLTTIGVTDPRSPPVQSLHLGIRSSESLSAQTPSHPELEVGVQISRRTRFWKMKVGKDVIQSVHPDDVRKRLRAMKAS